MMPSFKEKPNKQTNKQNTLTFLADWPKTGANVTQEQDNAFGSLTIGSKNLLL